MRVTCAITEAWQGPKVHVSQVQLRSKLHSLRLWHPALQNGGAQDLHFLPLSLRSDAVIAKALWSGLSQQPLVPTSVYSSIAVKETP